MSQLHLTCFQDDLKTINPRFRGSASSLKGLLDHLTRTVAAPQPLTRDRALTLCARAGQDPRTAKYLPAIDNLVKVWGRGTHLPYPQLRAGPRLAKVDINRICFRGDGRPPATIFSTGFTRRNKKKAATYRDFTVRNTSFQSAHDPVRSPIQGTARAGDLDPDSAVCVTPDMHVASLFPLPTTPASLATPIWVYVVYVTGGYNTNGRQVLDALAGLSDLAAFEQTEAPGTIPKAALHDVRVKDIVQNLYGREMAADSIPSNAVVGGFKVDRTWKTTKHMNEWDPVAGVMKKIPSGADYKDGGTYRVVEWVANPGMRWPSEGYRTSVAEFIAKMKGDIGVKTFKLPTTADGYHPSLKS